ncbi:MAG: arginase family protein [Gemmataceae bacterium]
MKKSVVVFPFDQFGSAGTGAGAQLLGDVVREILDDTEAETRSTRADVHRGSLEVDELAFDTIDQLRGWRSTGRKRMKERISRGEFVLWLTGNHLAVLPVLEELGPDTLVIQLDAHLDIHAFHDTMAELSHGNFLLHGATPLPRLVNVGHRDLLLMPEEINAVYAEAFSAENVACDAERVLKRVQKHAKAAKRIWLDIDCDAFDPAFLPAVQNPLPFGLVPTVVIQLLRAVGFDKLIGCSISEFDPGRDRGDASLNLLGWFIEWLLLNANR